LNSETFILYLADDITQKPELDGFPEVRLIDNRTLEVEVPVSRSINDLMQQLGTKNIVVTSMRNKVNRLEELFVRITTKQKEAIHAA